jgi:hypothetical protein
LALVFSISVNLHAIVAHREMEKPMSNNNNNKLENNGKSELPPQPSRGNVTGLQTTSPSSPDSFNPGWRFYAAFTSLCIVTLAVALDATSLSVALPVMLPLGHAL